MYGPVDTKIRLTIVRTGQAAPVELTIDRAPVRPQGVGAHRQAAGKGGLPVLKFEKDAHPNVEQ
jgi:C-terminal processing protease CtpA/Prc